MQDDVDSKIGISKKYVGFAAYHRYCHKRPLACLKKKKTRMSTAELRMAGIEKCIGFEIFGLKHATPAKNSGMSLCQLSPQVQGASSSMDARLMNRMIGFITGKTHRALDTNEDEEWILNCS